MPNVRTTNATDEHGNLQLLAVLAKAKQQGAFTTGWRALRMQRTGGLDRRLVSVTRDNRSVRLFPVKTKRSKQTSVRKRCDYGDKVLSTYKPSEAERMRGKHCPLLQ